MDFLTKRALEVALDLSASCLNQSSVVYAGGTRGHASDTAQARVKMSYPLAIHGCSTLARHFHEVDTAAGRVHFFVPQHVRGANGQAKTAVDALIDNVLRRGMMRIKGARRGGGGSRLVGHQIPPTKRPGFSVFPGSNCCFSERINSKASPGVPQGFMPFVDSELPRMTSEPPAASNFLRKALSTEVIVSASPLRRRTPRPVA